MRENHENRQASHILPRDKIDLDADGRAPLSPTTSSRPNSRISSHRQHSRPTLLSRHNSLADIAREHKLQSRPTSNNDIRKFFGEEVSDDNDELQDIDDPASLLHHSHTIDSAEAPNFIYRTGSHVYLLAGRELGESRHNSPSHSVAPSVRESRNVSSDEDEDETGSDGSDSIDGNTERIIFFGGQSSTESSDEANIKSYEKATKAYERSLLWNFIMRDLLGFTLEAPESPEAKQRERDKNSGIFDPALTLAIIASFIS